MKRLLVAAMLLILLSLTVPALRTRAMPKYRALGTWVWGVIDGPLSPILNPYRRLKTQSEMAEVVRELVDRRNRGLPPPTEAELKDFMAREALDSTATDVWGTLYHIEARPDSVYLRSAGPDTELGTEDDLLEVLRYRSYGRR